MYFIFLHIVTLTFRSCKISRLRTGSEQPHVVLGKSKVNPQLARRAHTHSTFLTHCGPASFIRKSLSSTGKGQVDLHGLSHHFYSGYQHEFILALLGPFFSFQIYCLFPPDYKNDIHPWYKI